MKRGNFQRNYDHKKYQLILASLGLLLYFHKINLGALPNIVFLGKFCRCSQLLVAVDVAWPGPLFQAAPPIDLSKLFSILNANILLVWTKKDICGTCFNIFPELFHPAPSPTVFFFAFNCKWKHSPLRQRNLLVRFSTF